MYSYRVICLIKVIYWLIADSEQCLQTFAVHDLKLSYTERRRCLTAWLVLTANYVCIGCGGCVLVECQWRFGAVKQFSKNVLGRQQGNWNVCGTTMARVFWNGCFSRRLNNQKKISDGRCKNLLWIGNGCCKPLYVFLFRLHIQRTSTRCHFNLNVFSLW